jgi:hypothetical protein
MRCSRAKRASSSKICRTRAGPSLAASDNKASRHSWVSAWFESAQRDVGFCNGVIEQNFSFCVAACAAIILYKILLKRHIIFI